MSDAIDEEFYAGYLDGMDCDAPEPSSNRSRCYLHGFMVARADRRGEPVPDVHSKAEEAERLDRAERDISFTEMRANDPPMTYARPVRIGEHDDD